MGLKSVDQSTGNTRYPALETSWAPGRRFSSDIQKIRTLIHQCQGVIHGSHRVIILPSIRKRIGSHIDHAHDQRSLDEIQGMLGIASCLRFPWRPSALKKGGHRGSRVGMSATIHIMTAEAATHRLNHRGPVCRPYQRWMIPKVTRDRHQAP